FPAWHYHRYAPSSTSCRVCRVLTQVFLWTCRKCCGVHVAAAKDSVHAAAAAVPLPVADPDHRLHLFAHLRLRLLLRTYHDRHEAVHRPDPSLLVGRPRPATSPSS